MRDGRCWPASVATSLPRSAGLSAIRRQRVCRRTCQCGTRKPFRIGSRDFAIGATVGFTRLRDKGDTLDDLMRKADIALYKAKESGRGGPLPLRRKWSARCASGVNWNRICAKPSRTASSDVEFQPIVDARTGQVVSSEVLVRWMHPTRGEVPPDTFIPIAEHAGLDPAAGQLGSQERRAQRRLSVPIWKALRSIFPRFSSWIPAWSITWRRFLDRDRISRRSAWFWKSPNRSSCVISARLPKS